MTSEPDSSQQNPCPWCGGHAYADAFIGGTLASNEPSEWPSNITLDDGSSILECRVWCSGCGAQGPHFDTGLVNHIDEAAPQIEQARNAWNAVASRVDREALEGETVVKFWR